MKNLITPKLMELAVRAGSIEELMRLAKENDVELAEADAAVYFEKLQGEKAVPNGEISDDELDNVSGGACGSREESGPNDSSAVIPPCREYVFNGDIEHKRKYGIACENCQLKMTCDRKMELNAATF